MLLNSRIHECLSCDLVRQRLNLMVQFLLLLGVEPISARLITINLALQVLIVQLSLDFSLIHRAFLLLYVQVVFMLLLGSLVFSFALIRINLFDFLVELHLQLLQSLILLLLRKFFDQIRSESFKFEVFLELFLKFGVPLDQVLFVFFDFFLVAFDVGVVLKLAAQFLC